MLNYNDFTSVRSSYEVKPKHIIELSETLNLGLESFVFIDDNPVEIAQVSSNFPSITCLQFNTDPELFYIFLRNLNSLFQIESLTNEDKARTQLYKQMLSSKKNTNSGTSYDKNTDLDKYLKSLKMKLHIRTCTHVDYMRPSQLINKTNQFNMNGVRRKVTK